MGLALPKVASTAIHNQSLFRREEQLKTTKFKGIVAMIDSVIDKCIRKSNLNVQALCPASNRECKESKRI